MIKVKIVNMAGLKNLGSVPPEIAKQAAKQLIVAARAKWVKLAQDKLKSSRIDYINAIQPPRTEGTSAYVISLVGAFPNMLEHGFSGFQLQQTLLSDTAEGWKTAADGGRYRAIPFRHKTPGTGPVGGQAMGSQFTKMAAAVVGKKAAEKAAFEFGKTIHARARRLITAQEKSAGRRGKTSLPAGLAPKLSRHHSTDIYAGMRVNKQVIGVTRGGKEKVQKTYSTFRTISQGPDGRPRPSGKWYHPGFQPGVHFADEVAKFIDKIAPDVVAGLAKGMTK